MTAKPCEIGFYKIIKAMNDLIKELADCPTEDFHEIMNSFLNYVAQVSLKLYQSLSSRGININWGKYLLKNRLEFSKSTPNEIEFYQHIHVIDYLVKNLNFLEANNACT